MFEDFYNKYESEEREIIALINEAVRTYDYDDGINICYIWTMGAVFCDRGELVIEKMRIDLPLTEADYNNEAIFNRLKHGQICKLKIRQMKAEYQERLPFLPWCLVDVVKDHDEHPQLSALFEEYSQDVVIHDDVLGTLVLDKRSHMFELEEVKWCTSTIKLNLYADPYDKTTWAKVIDFGRTMVINKESWDKQIREYGAESFTREVNDRLQGDWEFEQDELRDDVVYLEHLFLPPRTEPIEPRPQPEIVTTEQYIAESIVFEIGIYSDGRFEATYICPEYIGDAIVIAEGTVQDGITTADFDGFY